MGQQGAGDVPAGSCGNAKPGAPRRARRAAGDLHAAKPKVAAKSLLSCLILAIGVVRPWVELGEAGAASPGP